MSRALIGFLSISLSLLATGFLGAGIPDQPHPRLLFPQSREAAVTAAMQSDPVVAKLHQATVTQARKILKDRTCRYEIPDGKRLLRESRHALSVITHTAMVWRLGGGEEFRKRAIAEMDAACALQDWNPKHFLDVAEMATAVAIGYDWLYPTLSPEQRLRYETALIEKALKPAKKVYDSKGWWSNVRNNWSQVCGAGIGIAAAAVWEREPQLCEELFRSSTKLVEGCRVFYQPDGCYPEGPSYWHYGTNYQVLMLATCQSLGVPVEVEPTLHRSGEFILQVIGPTGYDYNFADAQTKRAAPTPAQSWIARHFQDRAQAKILRNSVLADPGRAASGRFSSLHLLWLPADPGPDAQPLPTSSRFDGEQPISMLRTTWSPDASWLAIKGGTGAASHGHLDAGSFIYESSGQRWMLDLGSDNYNMPAYFGGKRWNYYRLNNRSHNTLVIDDRLQAAPKEPCPITASGSNGLIQWLTIDLGTAYPKQAATAIRKATFNKMTGETTIHDRIKKPVGSVRWAFVTDAKATINGSRVLLEKKGHKLIVQREDKSGGEWRITDAKPPTEAENQNPGRRVISFTAPAAEQLDLKVRWGPAEKQ